MAETPSQPILLDNGKKFCASRSSSSWKTPMPMRARETLKTPRSHRLFASAGPKTPHGKSSSSYNYEGLLNKTWRVHALSPLFKFKSQPVSLRQYSRSLDIAFSKGTSLPGSETHHNGTQSSFSVYHGLSFHSDDPDAIRIQVTEKQDDTEKVVLTAILCSVDMENPSMVNDDVSDSFVIYPLLLVCGTKPRADILLEWLQRHFDCRSSPVEFTHSDLQWILALGCQQEEAKPFPILLKYSLKEVCDGVNTIDCKFESPFCKEIWDKLQDSSRNEEFMTENQVSMFVSALEAHLEYTMHIIFSKLGLSEVGTPICYMSKDGKLKILDSRGMYMVLHLICEVITWKYVQGFSFCR